MHTALAPAPHHVRILFVDDQPYTSKALTRLLRDEGHQVTTANTLQAARQLSARHAFDLLLADMGLPDVEGWVLMADLLKTCNIRGIAFGGHGPGEDVEHSRRAGFAEYLTMPVHFQRVVEAIARVTCAVARE